MPADQSSLPFFRAMLFAAGLTGATSFVYEISWVRMLNQALGTTVHSFELMLSAFILGLAFGGLWVRRRSSRLLDPVATAGWAQIWMGLAALVSLPLFAQSFHGVAFLVDILPRTDSGYAGFMAGSAIISMAVMFPAAFFAGMTLPLLTMASLRRGSGEAGIGRIYAVNTLGAILGVVLAVHVLIPMMGLQLAVTLAALADLALGVYLLRWLSSGDGSPRTLPAALALTLVVLASSLVLGRADPRMLTSGVFRTGHAQLDADVSVPFLRDGKTATVAVVAYEGLRNINTNGKPDGSLNLDLSSAPATDEITMILSGALPLALHREVRQVGVIGWGTGLTTHTLLGSADVERVDTIEIERAMVDGARLMGPRVHRAYDDPRSHLYIDDARTYFSAGRKQFDVILSMPSNPWVSGVASLFTKEFYGFIGRHLSKKGMLVQWVQTYELDNALLARMLAALDSEFPHVEVYEAGPGNLLLVASDSPLPALTYPAEPGSVFAEELRRVGLASVADFELRRLGNQNLPRTLVTLAGVPPHDDFHPVVSLQAPKARFKAMSADWTAVLEGTGLPVLAMHTDRHDVDAAALAPNSQGNLSAQRMADALLARSFLTGQGSDAGPQAAGLKMAVDDLADSADAEPSPERTLAWLAAVSHLAESTLAYLSPADSEGLWIEPVWTGAWQQDGQARLVLEAYAATARRDGPAMEAAATAALDQLDPASTPYLTKEHMLVIARLGAIANGNHAGSLALERQYGASIPATDGYPYGFVRAYLSAAAASAIPSPAS
ncbi:MAG: spermine synthase [Arenimonas sp.]|nr:spermine synthase [Arenimonas sp.]